MPAKPRSLYLVPYLDDSARRIASGGRPVTPGVFVSQHLRGAARHYHGRYVRALVRALDEEVRLGRVEEIRSVHGSTAYAPISLAA